MDRYHNIHRGFAALNVGAAFAGMAFRDTSVGLNTILMSVFLILLRVKFWFDDEAYLEDVQQGRLPGGLPFGFGMFLAVLSWILWTFAGFYIKDIELSSLLMIVMFAVSSAWVVAAMVKRGAYDEQVPWLFLNVIYCVAFALIFYRSASWNPFRATIEGFTTVIIGLLYALFVADLGITRVLEQKRRGARF